MSKLLPHLRSWCRKDAMILLKELSEFVRPDWGLALTGSLLFCEIGNDLDIIAYPYDGSEHDQIPVADLFVAYGMTQTCTVAAIHRHWRSVGSSDTKHVEVFHWCHKRIDLFTLR